MLTHPILFREELISVGDNFAIGPSKIYSTIVKGWMFREIYRATKK